jgi:hypothetical protein
MPKLSRCIILSLALTACARGREETKAPGPVVARVGDVELHEDDVQRAMARDPGASPARFATPAARRELVEGLVRFELLAQAAAKAGLTKDPDAIHAMQQIAVTKYVNRELGTAATPPTIGADHETEDPAGQRRYREERARALEELIGRLRASTPVEVHPEALAH